MGINFDFNHIMETEALKLSEEMQEMFRIEMPLKIETEDELSDAQKKMGKYVANYSYLTNIAGTLKITKRIMKREGREKNEIDEILSKEELFTNFAESSKLAYQCISRMLTVRQMALEELKVSGDVCWKP